MKSLDPATRRWGLLAGPVALALALNLPGHAQQPAWQRISDRLRPDESVGAAAPTAAAAIVSEAPAAEPAVESGAAAPVESIPDLAVEGDAASESDPSDSRIGLAGGGAESTIFLGKESDPDPGAPDLFSGDRFKQFLGENPRFVYDALALPDPMIFPPIRNAAKYQELTTQIAELLASSYYAKWQADWSTGSDSGEIDTALVGQARSLWERVLDMNDARFNEIAERGRNEIDAGLREYIRVKGLEPTPGPSMVTPTPAPPELPEEVETNTQGLIAHPTDPLALVGDLLLRRGESVPGYAGVVVEDVYPGIVVYRVTTSAGLSDTFPVEVRVVEERTDVGLSPQQLGKGPARRAPRRR